MDEVHPVVERVPGGAGRAIAAALGLGLGAPIAFLLVTSVLQSVIPALSSLLQGIVLLGLLLLAPWLILGGTAFGYLAYRGLDWTGMREYLGIRIPSIRALAVVLGGWILIFGLIFVLGAILQTLGAQPAENQTGEVARQLPALIPFLIVYMFIVVGPVEELLYRGVVQGRLRESLGPIPSIAIASAVFAAVHWFALVGGASGRLITIAVLFVPSLVFGAVYEYTENIVACALLHALHNSGLLVLLYIATQIDGSTATLLLG
ncbi:MAG: lysostaphin resistance A-like protein [Salinirussus sp.]